jgi:hypothetical protein
MTQWNLGAQLAGHEVLLLENYAYGGDVAVNYGRFGVRSDEQTVRALLAADTFAEVPSPFTAASNSGANLLEGYAGNDTLSGSLSNDVLQGGDGTDTLRGGAGNNLLDGGAGNDSLAGNTGNELFMGGAGNDTVNTGIGADIIAFNRGDGQDTVAASVGVDNALSLGDGIGYQDLALKKSGTNLILQLGVNPQTGTAEQITLQSWYSAAANNHSVLNLLVITEAMAGYDPNSSDPLYNDKVENFDFTALVAAFDQARAANTNLQSWSLISKLTDARLWGSDAQALGGDLAYQYGLNGSLAGISLNAAQDVLGSPQFGVQAQTLQPLAGLQGGAMRLS